MSKFSNDIVRYIHCGLCVKASMAGKQSEQHTVTAMVAGYTESGMLALWCENHGKSLGVYNVVDSPVKVIK